MAAPRAALFAPVNVEKRVADELADSMRLCLIVIEGKIPQDDLAATTKQLLSDMESPTLGRGAPVHGAADDPFVLILTALYCNIVQRRRLPPVVVMNAISDEAWSKMMNEALLALSNTDSILTDPPHSTDWLVELLFNRIQPALVANDAPTLDRYKMLQEVARAAHLRLYYQYTLIGPRTVMRDETTQWPGAEHVGRLRESYERDRTTAVRPNRAASDLYKRWVTWSLSPLGTFALSASFGTSRLVDIIGLERYERRDAHSRTYGRDIPASDRVLLNLWHLARFATKFDEFVESPGYFQTHMLVMWHEYGTARTYDKGSKDFPIVWQPAADMFAVRAHGEVLVCTDIFCVLAAWHELAFKHNDGKLSTGYKLPPLV